MFHIVDLNWDDEDARLWASLERRAKRDSMSGPCDDSHEVTCPYIGILPEESGKENGSPLKFNSEIDRQIEEAYRLGL